MANSFILRCTLLALLHCRITAFSLTTHIAAFLHHLRFEKRYAAHTLAAYQNDLGAASAYLQQTFEIEDPAVVSHFHLRSWLAGLREEGLQPRSINRKIYALSSFFKWAMRGGRVSKNPVRLIHPLKVPKRLPQFLKEEESAALLDDAAFGEGFSGATVRLMLELLYGCGLRRAELIGLKETDVQWSARQLRVLGKGNKERLVPLAEGTLQLIYDYLEDKDLLAQEAAGAAPPDRTALLIGGSGKPLYPGQVYRIVKEHLARVSSLKKRSPHVLRHTFATHLMNGGASIQAIRDLLGHASLAATQVYTHTDIHRLKELHKKFHPRG